MTTETKETPAPRRPARAVAYRGMVLATADVALPPERVFQALTTSEVERWWGSPSTYRMTEWIANLRVGGRWSVVVRRADGSVNPAGGLYLEVDPPHKVMQTQKLEWEHPRLGGMETTITYILEPIALGTRVIVRHEGFTGRRDAADEHVEGWERVLRWLSEYRPGVTGGRSEDMNRAIRSAREHPGGYSTLTARQVMSS